MRSWNWTEQSCPAQHVDPRFDLRVLKNGHAGSGFAVDDSQIRAGSSSADWSMFISHDSFVAFPNLVPGAREGLFGEVCDSDIFRSGSCRVAAYMRGFERGSFLDRPRDVLEKMRMRSDPARPRTRTVLEPACKCRWPMMCFHLWAISRSRRVYGRANRQAADRREI